MRTIREIQGECIPIPDTEWGIHPAVPVGLIARHATAQRASPLPRFRKKAGKFDRSIAGVLRLAPNGNKFYGVIGATRAELALEQYGPEYTIPAQVLLRDATEKEMAEWFLDELVSTPPGTATKQTVGEVTGRQNYLDVKWAREQLHNNLAVGALTIIRDQKKGDTLLRRTVDVAKKCFPRALARIPSPVLRGIALVLATGGTVRLPRRVTPHELLSRARVRQARHGGKGPIYGHVAAMLQGSR